jgi:hypothetical protein
MPRISAFYGIVIWMYYDEMHRRGRPRFHATYGEDEATIDIESLEIIAGELPPRGLRLVVEWGQAHRSELRTGTALGVTSPYCLSTRCGERSTIGVMRSTPRLAEARPLDCYIVRVRFDDGTTTDVDLSYVLDYGGIFKPLRDPVYFAQLRSDAEAGTIVWPNGADIAPETLYAHAQRHAAARA